MKRFPFTLYIESGTNYVDHVSSNEFVIFTLISFQKSVIVKWTLESLRNGDGNKNGKKAKHNSARASRYFIHVSSLTPRLQREIVLFHVLRRR